MQWRYTALGAFIVIVVAATAAWYLMAPAQPEVDMVSADGLSLDSTAFDNNGTIPEKYTADGQDVSPPLEFSGVEGDTLALIMDDPDANGFVHWLVWNIPADLGSVPEGVPKEETVQALEGAVQGRNDFGVTGYRGPKPPEGEDHLYRIRCYSLDGSLDLEPGASKGDLLDAMEGHVVQMTEYVGNYER